MPNVTFYFEVHQPFRLKRVLSFEHTAEFIDTKKNREIFDRVSDKCYIPTTKILIQLSKEHPEFKTNFSFTGTFFEQAEAFRPDVISAFQELVDIGSTELLDETYYHSLAFLMNREEFIDQVKEHSDMVKKYFGKKPTIFRNTEAMYSNEIADLAAKLGYKGIIAEGWDKYLGGRSPNYVYNPPSKSIPVLLRNYRLSDDVSFRFSSREWKDWPLTADKYAEWVSRSEGDTVNLFMDYETFGEHQWKDTGIFDFLKALPTELIKRRVGFNTISESAALKSAGVIDVPDIMSWADLDRDLSAWLGNKMQDAAFKKLYSMRESVLTTNNLDVLRDWRLLQTSDNFYYMCTKWFADGDIHKYFNAYASPYLAYINYCNILSAMDKRIKSFLEQSRTHQSNSG